VKNATDPKTLIRDLRDCIVEAMTPPFGPVVMIVGSNISMSENNESILEPQLPNPHFAPPYEVFTGLAEKLAATQTPGILIGDGIARSQAFDELMEVATLLGAQVWGSMESEINFPRNHGLYKGNLGHMDDSVGRELLADLDFALAVGTPIYQTVFNSKEPLFKSGVGVAAINPDMASTLKGHTDIDFPIMGDLKTSLALLAKAIKEKQNEKQAFYAKERISEMEEAKKATIAKDKKALLEKPGVTMAKFAKALEEKLSTLEKRPIIFNEALNGAVGLTNFIRNIDLPGKYYDTCGGSLGEWAGGVGAAYVAGPTLSFIGDGGFNYAPQVLWNAAHKNLPIGFVVAHNTEYGLLYDNMKFMLEKKHIDPATIPQPHYYDLPKIDFVKIAEGYGVAGMRVEQESQIYEAVNQLVDFSKPFLIDLLLAK
jgi:benzoylformate decarboxylase